jgi:hypothetical protein
MNIVFKIDVMSLELEFHWKTYTGGKQDLFYCLTEWLHHLGLGLEEIVPEIVCVDKFQVLPIDG